MPVTKYCTKKILEQMDQMEQSFYKISPTNQNDKFGNGIFCKIKINQIIIPILITSCRVIDGRYVEYNDSFNILINNELKTIEFGDKIYKYINKEYDLTVIRIKENNEIKLNFIELDDKLYEKESEMIYSKESIYIIHYNNQNKISVSYGIINYISKSQLICSCNINPNENCAPIFNLYNNQLIGIYNISKYYAKGIVLKYIINEFIKIHKNKKVNNEIEITIQVDKEDINKNIYYLNKVFEQLNELNTELYINEKRSGFNKYFKPNNEGEYNIKLKFYINLINCSYMFAECVNIIDINFISFKSNYITNMEYMFYNCINLKTINLDCFYTKNVTNMSGMFYWCKNLNILNLYSFDTKNVIDMSEMFNGCKNLTNINLSSFDTKNVINMSGMFYECNKLNNLDLSSFDTSKVTNMREMFYNCKSLNDLNLSFFNTKNVTNVEDMFYGCSDSKLNFNFPNFNKFNKEELIKVINNEINLFVDIRKEDVKKNIYFLDNGYEEYKNGKKVKYYNHDNLKELNEFNTELYINDKRFKYTKFFKPDKIGEYKIRLKFNINLTNCSYMFVGCHHITYIDFISFNTKDITDMKYMFYNCANLKDLNLSPFNTKNVVNMSRMFYECHNLESLNLSSFNTKNVIDMSYIFCNCVNLNELNLSSFDTKNVTNMCGMFSSCENLHHLDLSSFDTKNVNDMSEMFRGCNNLNTLNISSFDTKNVTDMGYMFSGCRNLIDLDLSSFDTKNVTFASGVFNNCSDNIVEENISIFKNFKEDYLYSKFGF